MSDLKKTLRKQIRRAVEVIQHVFKTLPHDTLNRMSEISVECDGIKLTFRPVESEAALPAEGESDDSEGGTGEGGQT